MLSEISFYDETEVKTQDTKIIGIYFEHFI